MTSDLVFDGTAFDVVTHGGQPCLTIGDVAAALYGEKGEAQSDTPFEHRLKKLFRRHAEEFTASMTALVKLQTAGGVQEVRIFSLRGAHLLAMFARTERAKEFRRWALDVLDEHVRERKTLTSQLHQAIAKREVGKAVASLCGKGLNEWKGTKSPLDIEIERLRREMQPGLFLN